MSTLARVTLVVSQGGKKMTCGLDFEAFDEWTQGTLEDAAQAAYDEWNTAVTGAKVRYASSTLLDHVEAYAYDIAAISPVPPAPPLYHRVPTLGVFGSTGAPIAGTYPTTGNAPPQVAVVYSFYTAVLSRKGRGRIYTPAPPEGLIDSAGEVDATYLADLEASWLAIIEGIEAAPVTIAPVEHIVASMTYNETNTVTSYNMRDRVDTQRRRLIRSIDT